MLKIQFGNFPAEIMHTLYLYLISRSDTNPERWPISGRKYSAMPGDALIGPEVVAGEGVSVVGGGPAIVVLPGIRSN